MSSDGYYYQSTPYTPNTSSYNDHNHSSSNSSSPPFPLHLCFFLATLFLFVVMSWYLSYDSLLEGVVDNLRILLILSPLLLLLALHCLSSDRGGRGGAPFFLSPPERDSFHRAGGSPWGVALVLVLLLFMVSYQSSFQGRWFPLLSRSRTR